MRTYLTKASVAAACAGIVATMTAAAYGAAATVAAAAPSGTASARGVGGVGTSGDAAATGAGEQARRCGRRRRHHHGGVERLRFGDRHPQASRRNLGTAGRDRAWRDAAGRHRRTGHRHGRLDPGQGRLRAPGDGRPSYLARTMERAGRDLRRGRGPRPISSRCLHPEPRRQPWRGRRGDLAAGARGLRGGAGSGQISASRSRVGTDRHALPCRGELAGGGDRRHRSGRRRLHRRRDRLRSTARRGSVERPGQDRAARRTSPGGDR